MAAITEKLYPPSIEGTIPAFYAKEDGTAIIAVPFSLNRAVDVSNIKDLRLKIKTVQSSALLTEEPIACSNPSNALKSLVADFSLPKEIVDKMLIGQYFKVQLAFEGVAGIGYYSTVGVIKFTARPQVTIQNILNESADIPPFKRNYIGLYHQELDTSEKVYQYIFNLYNSQTILVQSSGWLLHNSSIDTSSNTLSSLQDSTDVYEFSITPIPYQIYQIEYGVRTINGLEVYSRRYQVMDIEGIEPDLKAELIAKNNFDNGYIELNLNPQSEDITTSGSYLISRSEKEDNFSLWHEIKRIIIKPSSPLGLWNYRDYTVEQGKTYKYCLQQYNDLGFYSSRIESNLVVADFEDMFLYDGIRQLKIRFNPQVSSFKIDRLEQKMDTIGSKYPFIFKNGRVEYREFPISGLISYLEDEAELFTNYDILNLQKDNRKRGYTPSGWVDIQQPTTTLQGYNYYAERKFKLDVLNWLSNGEIKLFRSPAEGNYIVRLMNTSLTPADNKLSRLVHNFQATAYEVADCDYKTLVKIGFIDPTDEEMTLYAFRTIGFVQNGYYQHGKLNSEPIAGWVFIENMIPGSFVYVGEDGQVESERTKYIIGPNGSLAIDVGDTMLGNVYLPTEKDENGKYIYNFQGQMTYRYITKPVNRFSLIRSIQMRNEVKVFSGPMDIIEQFAQSSKREIHKFFNLTFYKKPLHHLYTRENRPNIYYTDPNMTMPIEYFEDTANYAIHYSSTKAPNLYTCQEGKLIKIDSLDYSITINGQTALEPPRVSLIDESYEELKFGNGIYCNCAYQVKLITYEIEYTDAELIEARQYYGADSLTYDMILSQKIAALQEEQEG